MKVRIWQINGYKGNTECDNPSEYNMHTSIAMDARFSKNNVENIMLNHFSQKYRYVELNAVFLAEKEV